MVDRLKKIRNYAVLAWLYFVVQAKTLLGWCKENKFLTLTLGVAIPMSVSFSAFMLSFSYQILQARPPFDYFPEESYVHDVCLDEGQTTSFWVQVVGVSFGRSQYARIESKIRDMETGEIVYTFPDDLRPPGAGDGELLEFNFSYPRQPREVPAGILKPDHSYQYEHEAWAARYGQAEVLGGVLVVPFQFETCE